jgi:hypothetical protein
MKEYFPNLPTSNVRESLVSLTVPRFEQAPVGIIYGKKNSSWRLAVWCSYQLHKKTVSGLWWQVWSSSMDKLPPAISMFASTVSTTIHLTVKSSAFDGPPAQNTWHVLPHSHSSGTRRTRPSVKYWQTSGSYTYFSCSSNGIVTVRASTGAIFRRVSITA